MPTTLFWFTKFVNMSSTTHQITKPKQLCELAQTLNQQELEQAKLHLELKLLHSPCDQQLREACRNSAKRYRIDAQGPEDTPICHERLDSGPWSKSWRTALAASPAANLDKITFDMSMLKATTPDGVGPHWYTQMDGNKDAIGLDGMHVYRLCIALATVMRMRSRNQVAFEPGGGWRVLEDRGNRRDLAKESMKVQRILKDLSRAGA